MAQLKKSTSKKKTSKSLKQTKQLKFWPVVIALVLLAISGGIWVWKGSAAANPSTVVNNSFEGCRYSVTRTLSRYTTIEGVKFPVFKISAKILDFSTACSKLEFRYTHQHMQTLATPTANQNLGNGFVGYAGPWKKQQLPAISYDVAYWGSKIGVQVKSGSKVDDSRRVL